MIVAKRQLEVDVENLEAKYKTVQVAQTSAPFNIDDSELGRVKDLIAEVRTRLSVAEKLVNAQCDIDGEIPVAGPQTENIVDQVTEYFSAKTRRHKSPKPPPRSSNAVKQAGVHTTSPRA